MSPVAASGVGEATRFGIDWQDRMAVDRRLAVANQTAELRAISDEIQRRALTSGALSFAITGSTAVDRRTRVSDLDFYVVGKPIDLPFADVELDVYVISERDFVDRLTAGDDYAHWTLRFGLILHDTGPMRDALAHVRAHRLWPDPSVKADQTARALDLCRSILETRDYDAAVEQCRITFSLAARWWLLREHVFPRARADLPGQLAGTALEWLGDPLRATIYGEPEDRMLLQAVARLGRVLERFGQSARASLK